MTAAWMDDGEIIHYLVTHKADPNGKGRGDLTPLAIASQNGKDVAAVALMKTTRTPTRQWSGWLYATHARGCGAIDTDNEGAYRSWCQRQCEERRWHHRTHDRSSGESSALVTLLVKAGADVARAMRKARLRLASRATRMARRDQDFGTTGVVRRSQFRELGRVSKIRLELARRRAVSRKVWVGCLSVLTIIGIAVVGAHGQTPPPPAAAKPAAGAAPAAAAGAAVTAASTRRQHAQGEAFESLQKTTMRPSSRAGKSLYFSFRLQRVSRRQRGRWHVSAADQ